MQHCTTAHSKDAKRYKNVTALGALSSMSPISELHFRNTASASAFVRFQTLICLIVWENHLVHKIE